MHDTEVAVAGAGVVGSAVALALARRGVAVALLEAEAEPGLAASGTNSGILHTGFDSPPGELETTLILRAAALRDPVLEALPGPVWRCAAVVGGRHSGEGAPTRSTGDSDLRSLAFGAAPPFLASVALRPMMRARSRRPRW